MIIVVTSVVALFGGVLGCLELGRQLYRRHKAAGRVPAEGLTTLEGAVFSLFGLLLAFSFSGAVERFAGRRAQIVREANAISTAYSRLDLLAAGPRAELQGLLRQYVDTRLDAYRRLPDPEAFEARLADAEALYGRIWAGAVAACAESKGTPGLGVLVLPPLNDMSDIAFERTAAPDDHPPLFIFVSLFVLAWLSALLAGYSKGDCEGRRAIHRVIFAVAVALTVYVTLDLEFPRFGLIRLDAADALLHRVRRGMGP